MFQKEIALNWSESVKHRVTCVMLTLCLPVSSADNLGKQFGPRSGPTNRWARSGSRLFDILMVFLKDFFQKVNFEKISRRQKHEQLPSMQCVKECLYKLKYM